MIHRFSIADRGDKLISGQNRTSFRSDVDQHSTPIQLYDPASMDMVFANKIAQEIIHITGASLNVYIRTNNKFDETWEEDADPTYYRPQHLKGYFAPQPIKAEMTEWGLDISNQTTVVFCREEVFKLFGKRMIREDDVIELPYNSSMENRQLGRYKVLNAADSGNFRYNWVYWSCVLETLPNDENLDIVTK